MEKDLTSGSVLKNIFTFSLPYLLSYFLQTLYGMADLFLVPSSMLSTVSALGAQNIGAGKYDRVDKILWYAIAIGVGFGAVMALLMQFIAPSVVRPFTSDEAVRPTSAATSSTACSRASSSASAAISAPGAGRGCRFCTTPSPSCWCVCRAHGWPAGSSLRPSCRWVLPRPAARCSPASSASCSIAG